MAPLRSSEMPVMLLSHICEHINSKHPPVKHSLQVLYVEAREPLRPWRMRPF